VKLYSYSSELHTFVEVKWAVAKFAAAGIFIGTAILFGVMRWNQLDDSAPGPRLAITLAAENDMLRQQLSLISPRVRKLEMEAKQLHERANNLQMLFHGAESVFGDTVRSFTNVTKGAKVQSLVPETAGFSP
jgi:hypothetical protein